MTVYLLYIYSFMHKFAVVSTGSRVFTMLHFGGEYSGSWMADSNGSGSYDVINGELNKWMWWQTGKKIRYANAFLIQRVCLRCSPFSMFYLFSSLNYGLRMAVHQPYIMQSRVSSGDIGILIMRVDRTKMIESCCSIRNACWSQRTQNGLILTSQPSVSSQIDQFEQIHCKPVLNDCSYFVSMTADMHENWDLWNIPDFLDNNQALFWSHHRLYALTL